MRGIAPSLTVVIPTLGQDLTALAEAVASATPATQQVIVVRQGGSPHHGPFRDAVGGARVVDDTGSGRSRARNLGLQVAGGEWVLFLQDDARLLPDLARVSAALPLLGHAGVVAWRGAGPGGRPLARYPADPVPIGRLNHWRLVQDGSAMWRTAAVQELGGFDETVEGDRSADLAIRLLASGRAGYWLPYDASAHGSQDHGGGRDAARVVRKHACRPAAWSYGARRAAGAVGGLARRADPRDAYS